MHTPAPDYVPEPQRATFMGYRRPDGRVGIRNWILIVPTSMCAAHEAVQIATVAEFTLFDKAKYPNVDGVVAIPHNKGCGCSDGSNIEVMLRTLADVCRAPQRRRRGLHRARLREDQPDGDGEVPERPAPAAQQAGGADRHPGRRRHAGCGQARARSGGGDAARGQPDHAHARTNQRTLARREVRRIRRLLRPVGQSGARTRGGSNSCAQGGTVLITEVPEFCGAEHILAWRAKDAETGHAVYDMVDWYKDYASKFGTVLNENPSPGNVAGGLLNITIKSLGAIAKAGTTRVEGVVGYAEQPKGRGLYLMQGPGYDQESTPGLIASGAQLVVFTTGRGTTIGNAIAPVIKLASNNPIFERMKSRPRPVGRRRHRRYRSIDEVGLERLRARPARRQRRDARQVGGEQAPRVPGVGRAERQPVGSRNCELRNSSRHQQLERWRRQ